MIALGLFSFNAGAQSNSDGSSPQFLFPEFIKGEVKIQNGRSQFAILNYNTVSEKMVYKQDDKIYDMIGIENIDTIFIYKSKFIPAGKIFHEVLVKDSMSLFVQHKGVLLPPGKPAGYGGTSQLASSTYMSSVQLSSGYYNLDLPDDYEVKIDPVYWVKKDGKMSSYISEKQFLRLFPESEAELKKFIKQNKIRFDRIPDMIKVAEYYNEISIGR
jgi:hypothetical protein